MGATASGYSEPERIAIHEAGHHVVAAIFGWRLGPITIEPGRSANGCSINTPQPVEVPVDVDYGAPFVRWPAAVRQRIEGEALMYIAGGLAELLFAPVLGRGPEPVTLAAAGLVAGISEASDPPPAALPAATPEECAVVRAVCDDAEIVSDAERIARLAHYAHVGDPAAAGAWIGWLDCQARALLLANEQRARRLADVLLATGTIGGEAAARLLA